MTLLQSYAFAVALRRQGSGFVLDVWRYCVFGGLAVAVAACACGLVAGRFLPTVSMGLWLIGIGVSGIAIGVVWFSILLGRFDGQEVSRRTFNRAAARGCDKITINATQIRVNVAFFEVPLVASLVYVFVTITAVGFMLVTQAIQDPHPYRLVSSERTDAVKSPTNEPTQEVVCLVKSMLFDGSTRYVLVGNSLIGDATLMIIAAVRNFLVVAIFPVIIQGIFVLKRS